MSNCPSDSDEDNEAYFLRSVNEYNILEKIEEANRELFADLQRCEEATNHQEPTKRHNRRVSFAEILESYAPQPAYSTTQSDDESNKTDMPTSRAHPQRSLHALDGKHSEDQMVARLSRVDEEQEQLPTNSMAGNIGDDGSDGNDGNGEYIPEEIQTNTNTSSNANANANGSEASDCQSGSNWPGNGDDINVEEITEELQLLDMDSPMPTPMSSSTSTLTAAAGSRRFTKQASMVIDDGDNKSMSNLLISDQEDDTAILKPLNGAAGPSSAPKRYHATDYSDDDYDDDNDPDDEDADDDDDDDDDDLSMLVAAYLPDDFDIGEAERKRAASSRSKSMGKAKGEEGEQRASGRFSGAKSFCRRFSFRRRSNAANNNHNNNNNNSSGSSGSGKRQRIALRTMASGNQDIKLNYKICCEYRNSDLEKLPKYTGYLSEYGLSREQLAKRHEKLERKKRYNLEQTLKTSEKELLKMKDNERAFTTWLKNKIRFPINKTRNMFDVRKNTVTDMAKTLPTLSSPTGPQLQGKYRSK